VTRFVVDAPVVIRLAADRARIAARHALLAPASLRSEVLALVYASVRAGERDE
jgi:phage tail sheath gpL-like